jgi:DNA-binding PucR family transcriptional regulator
MLGTVQGVNHANSYKQKLETLKHSIQNYHQYQPEVTAAVHETQNEICNITSLVLTEFIWHKIQFSWSLLVQDIQQNYYEQDWKNFCQSSISLKILWIIY